MSAPSRGFAGRPDRRDVELPPGQYLAEGFPVLSAGPTPHVPLSDWTLTVRGRGGRVREWDWRAFRKLPAVDVTVDLHCVTGWSKLDTAWRGVMVDTLLDGIDGEATYAVIDCYGGYTTNVPVADLRDGQALVAFGYDGTDLPPEHGGPARLLVPHLYLWKSAKWLRRITVQSLDEPGFWERNGYHNHGDPWTEQRYSDDLVGL
jgi:DMSO/TMAO reductase YedYZ molybdopterin-dependent catalytic subunit